MAYRGKKVFITGADGFIGSHLAEALAHEGAVVTALALYHGMDDYGWLEDIDPEVRANIKMIRGDVRDPAMMLRLVANQDVVFHLAALIGIPHSFIAPFSYIDVNVTGTANILEAARSHGTPRVVNTSTSEVYGTAQTVPISEEHPLVAQSPYAASKIAADKLVESYALSFDLPVVTLRPFNTYGPRQSERAVISTVIRQTLDPGCDVIALGDTDPVRDFNYISDTVSAFLSIGDGANLKYGIPYNAGSGIGVTIGEMVDLVRDITGTNKPTQTDKERIRPENAEVMKLIANANLITNATGWRPAFDLRTGLSSTVEWWRKRIGSGRTRSDASYMV